MHGATLFRRRVRGAALAAALALGAAPAVAQVYKTVDENGDVVFSDRPSTGAEEVETRAPAPGAGASADSREEIVRLQRAADALERDRKARAAERKEEAEAAARRAAASKPPPEPKLRRYGRFLVPEGVEPPFEAVPQPSGGGDATLGG